MNSKWGKFVLLLNDRTLFLLFFFCDRKCKAVRLQTHDPVDEIQPAVPELMAEMS
jgi:hypothetical protein